MKDGKRGANVTDLPRDVQVGNAYSEGENGTEKDRANLAHLFAVGNSSRKHLSTPGGATVAPQYPRCIAIIRRFRLQTPKLDLRVNNHPYKEEHPWERIASNSRRSFLS